MEDLELKTNKILELEKQFGPFEFAILNQQVQITEPSENLPKSVKANPLIRKR